MLLSLSRNVACLIVCVTSLAVWADDWLGAHRMRRPPVNQEGVCKGEIGALPVIHVFPERSGACLVRAAIPFPPAALPEGMGIMAVFGDTRIAADVRPLTFHPGRPVSARRAMVTFPYDFSEAGKHTIALELGAPTTESLVLSHEMTERSHRIATRVGVLTVNEVGVDFESVQGTGWRAVLIAPPLKASTAAEIEWVERGNHFLWIRLLVPDKEFPRIIEARMDAFGGVGLAARIQRMKKGNDAAPDLGWEIAGLPVSDSERLGFANGEERILKTEAGSTEIRFPRADKERRGYAQSKQGTVRFLRCTEEEGVPFQESAWRSAIIAIDPAGHPRRTPLLEYSLSIQVAPEALNQIYEHGLPESLSLWPQLQALHRFTRAALCRAAAIGDDFGNVTSYHQHSPHGAVFGMNRLNHAAAMFEEAWRSGDAELLQTALLWCDNMHDLSLWWGPGNDFGGTRYNNAVAAGEKEHEGDTNFMWRTNYASNFCAKGMDAFFLAYEETGDPRMMAALHAQLAYAREHVHVNRGEARNIGNVADFTRLYRYTGDPSFLREALRLFRELRECLSKDHLFSQGGKPILERVPFIDEDQKGMEHPFAKPYILGYALAGLPGLLEIVPDEPKLAEVVRSVAHFMANAQDPVGGWRYPHPDSSRMIIDQAMEHAAQLARAARVLHARGEAVEPLLHAIERALRARIMGYAVSGTVLSGLTGWEEEAGLLKGKSIYDLYQWPEDRDKSRDYLEGNVATGSSSPEGLAHYFEALRFYLDFRQPERLFSSGPQLGQVLSRAPRSAPEVELGEETLTIHLGTAKEGLVGARLTLMNDNLSPISGSRDGNGTVVSGNGTYRWSDFWGRWSLDIISGPETLDFALCLQPETVARAGHASFVWNVVAPAAGDPILYTQNGAVSAGAFSGPETIVALWQGKDAVSSILFYAPHVARVEPSKAGEGAWDIKMSMPLRKDGHSTSNLALMFQGDVRQRRAVLHDIFARPVLPYGYPPETSDATPDYGMRAMLPVFHEARIARMNFPRAFTPEKEFVEWRLAAREAYIHSLLDPPPRAPFHMRVTATEDRGDYECRKLAFNISADERVPAYLLVPKGTGPFPAILALHDHGAHFGIGKEKVVRPFDVPAERTKDALQWVGKYYGGRFIGDELAQRGYVVLAVDALFWGDCGRKEGPDSDYASQQELASNLLLLGQCWAGIIVWNDARCAEFLAGLPEVDPERIGAIGLSMGAHRTWNLCAATDIARAGAAICWMGDTLTLTSEGNNQTHGQSAFSMTFPGLRNLMDYADVAAIACPKPMLFYNGARDELFPVSGVEAAYARMRRVYEASNVSNRLETRIWDAPHEFNTLMQQEAFDWLDRWLKEAK